MTEPDEQLTFLQDEVDKFERQLTEARHSLRWYIDYRATRRELEEAARKLMELDQDSDDIGRWAQEAAETYLLA